MLLAPNIYKFFASAKPTLRALRAFEAIRAFNAMTKSYCAVEAVGFRGQEALFRSMQKQWSQRSYRMANCL